MGGFVVRVRGQHEHWRPIPLAPEPLENVIAGELRKSAIKHNHVIRPALRHGESRRAIGRAIHLEAFRFKESSGRLRNSLVVLDEQNAYSATLSCIRFLLFLNNPTADR